MYIFFKDWSCHSILESSVLDVLEMKTKIKLSSEPGSWHRRLDSYEDYFISQGNQSTPLMRIIFTTYWYNCHLPRIGWIKAEILKIQFPFLDLPWRPSSSSWLLLPDHPAIIELTVLLSFLSYFPGLRISFHSLEQIISECLTGFSTCQEYIKEQALVLTLLELKI